MPQPPVEKFQKLPQISSSIGRSRVLAWTMALHFNFNSSRKVCRWLGIKLAEKPLREIGCVCVCVCAFAPLTHTSFCASVLMGHREKPALFGRLGCTHSVWEACGCVGQSIWDTLSWKGNKTAPMGWMLCFQGFGVELGKQKKEGRWSCVS